MSHFHQAGRVVQYKLKANSAHGVHSPFIYRFVEWVLNDTGEYYAYRKLSQVRKKLLLNEQQIKVTDFGAGSSVFKSNFRKVKDIARVSVSPEKYAKLLFRLVNYFSPDTVVELGTSIGLTTLYLESSAKKSARIYSLEGCPETAGFAQKLFTHHSAHTINLMIGEFDESINELCTKENKFDFVYIDGNHRKEATIRYFEYFLPFLHSNSLLVFDDINWSKEMTQAWETIVSHDSVKVSIDLHKFGLVFFRKENKEKEHFVLKF